MKAKDHPALFYVLNLLLLGIISFTPSAVLIASAATVTGHSEPAQVNWQKVGLPADSQLLAMQLGEAGWGDGVRLNYYILQHDDRAAVRKSLHWQRQSGAKDTDIPDQIIGIAGSSGLPQPVLDYKKDAVYVYETEDRSKGSHLYLMLVKKATIDGVIYPNVIYAAERISPSDR